VLGGVRPPERAPGRSLAAARRAWLRRSHCAQASQRRSKGVRKEAARLLGIDPRNLNYYMRKHRLEDDDQ